MRLTWKDGLSTALAALGAFVVVPLIAGWDWAPFESYRIGVVALGVLGEGMCLMGRELGPGMRATPYVVFSCVLGGGALCLFAAGLVTGSRTLFIALALTMGVLWLASTARHALGMTSQRAVTA